MLHVKHVTLNIVFTSISLHYGLIFICRFTPLAQTLWNHFNLRLNCQFEMISKLFENNVQCKTATVKMSKKSYMISLNLFCFHHLVTVMMISVTVMAMTTATEQKPFISGDEDSAGDEDKHNDGFRRVCERFRRRFPARLWEMCFCSESVSGGCEKRVLERNEIKNTVFVLERNQMGFCLVWGMYEKMDWRCN